MEFIKEYINENPNNNNEEKQITPAIVANLFEKFQIKQHYKRNPDQYCNLLIDLINQIVDKNELLVFVNNKNVFDKSLLECEQVRKEFLDRILTILIEQLTKYENDPKLFNSISNLLQKCIFDKNMQSFDCYFNQHPTETCTDEHVICRKLLEFLQIVYNKEIACCSYKMIFQSFCTTFENNFNLNYKMLIILFNLIGFNVKNHFKLNNSLEVDISKLDFNRTLEITNQLFECLPNLKIDDNHRIDNLTINDFLTNILKSIIPLTQHPNNCCYDIIINLIEFNPLIIVKIIDEIIVYMIVTDNSAIMDKYCYVFVKIIQLFSKLHRLNFFLSRLIRVLKQNYYNGRQMNKTIYGFNNIIIKMQPICYNIDEILPKIVLNTFTNCMIRNITNREVINLLKTCMFHLNEVVEEMQQQNYDKPLIYIEIVTTLLCQILNSVCIAEHTNISSVVKKFHEELNEISTILNKFATILLHQEHNHTLMTTFLNVCHNWGEIYMILAYYRPNDVDLIKTNDNDNTACNITYLHYYLTKEQWCLISERVMNFGENPCKGIMYKLMIQKLRAMTIFDDLNDDVITPIIKQLYTKFDNVIVDITTMKFVVNHLINKLSLTIIIEICETILNNLLNDKNNHQSHIYDNQLIINGLLYNIFMKINKLLIKQKRRHDDQQTIKKKSLLTKIMKLQIDDLLFNQDLEQNVTILQFFNDHIEQSLDLQIDDDKILKLIDILKKLPIVSCDENIKKIVFLLLLALQCDLYSSECCDDLKTTCESVIIGIAMCCKLPPIQIVSSDLLQIIITKFDRFDSLYGYLVDKIFKNHRSIPEFHSAIDYLTKNLDDDRHLKCTMITLDIIRKVKSKKLEDDVKSTCNDQESIIYRKLFKMIKKHPINNNLIQPYALTLEYFINTRDNNEKSLTLMLSRLSEVYEYIFNNYNDNNLNNSLLLFKTILNNKSIINYDEEIGMKIWHYLKTIQINDDCSQLITLIITQIPDEKFTQIINELLEYTINLINSRDFNAVFKCMKIWINLILCDLNLKKQSSFLGGFEKLFHHLIEMVKTIDYSEDVFDEITNLYLTAIQTIRLSLTSDILDSFFVYTTVLITLSKQSNFVHLFKLSISIIESLLIHRSPLIMDRLSAYLLQYRLLLKHLCIHANTDVNYHQQDFIDNLSNCALELEKLTRTLITHPKDMARISPYLISDILMQYEQKAIHTQIKLHLNNCLYLLISLCDQHAVQFLMEFLSNASTTIFKVVYRQYQMYYKFKGKI